MNKRCPFCAHKLDDKGFCHNEKCPDYKRTLLLETEEQRKSEDDDEDGDE